jgi:hypothetical protein
MFIANCYAVIVILKDGIPPKAGLIELSLKILFLYILLLTLLTFLRGGVIGLLYSLKDYLAPFLFGFFVVHFIKPRNYHNLIVFITLISAIAGLIYLYEFYKYNSGGGYMDYAIGMREMFFSRAQAPAGGAKMHTIISGYIRLPGPLSHNNATGLFLAIGSILSVAVIKFGFTFLGRALLIICVTSLFVSMARTSMLALIVGTGVYIWVLGINRRLFFGMFLSVIFIMLLISIFSTLNQHLNLFEFERIWNTLMLILSSLNKLISIDRAYNLIVGSGFSYDGYIYHTDAFGPLLSDDLFFVQMLSMFGIFPLLLFFLSFFRGAFRVIKSQADKGINYVIVVVSFSAIVTMLTSTIHTNSLVRPQLFPVFFIFIFILYRYEQLNNRIKSQQFKTVNASI